VSTSLPSASPDARIACPYGCASSVHGLHCSRCSGRIRLCHACDQPVANRLLSRFCRRCGKELDSDVVWPTRFGRLDGSGYLAGRVPRLEQEGATDLRLPERNRATVDWATAYGSLFLLRISDAGAPECVMVTPFDGHVIRMGIDEMDPGPIADDGQRCWSLMLTDRVLIVSSGTQILLRRFAPAHDRGDVKRVPVAGPVRLLDVLMTCSPTLFRGAVVVGCKGASELDDEIRVYDDGLVCLASRRVCETPLYLIPSGDYLWVVFAKGRVEVWQAMDGPTSSFELDATVCTSPRPVANGLDLFVWVWSGTRPELRSCRVGTPTVHSLMTMSTLRRPYGMALIRTHDESRLMINQSDGQVCTISCDHGRVLGITDTPAIGERGQCQGWADLPIGVWTSGVLVPRPYGGLTYLDPQPRDGRLVTRHEVAPKFPSGAPLSGWACLDERLVMFSAASEGEVQWLP
jgi:hypothetical protein